MVVPLRELLTNWLQRKREDAAVVYCCQIWYWGRLWSFYNVHCLNSFTHASIPWCAHCAGVLAPLKLRPYGAIQIFLLLLFIIIIINASNVCSRESRLISVLVRREAMLQQNELYCDLPLSLPIFGEHGGNGSVRMAVWLCAKMAKKWPYLRCWPDPRVHTIRHGRLTCAQKLTRWPA